MLEGRTPTKRLQMTVVTVVAWAALVLAVGQAACADEHHLGGGIESAACLVIAVALVRRRGMPPRFTAFVRATTAAIGMALAPLPAPEVSTARGSPLAAVTPLRC